MMGTIWSSKPYKIHDRNRIVIPDEIIKKFNLQNGDNVVYFLENNNEVRLGFKYLSRETVRKISQIKK